MGEITKISPTDIGCPSGLQETPISAIDPLAGQLSLASFVHEMDGVSSIDLIVQGAHCGGCMAKIERNMIALSGVRAARMNLSTMRLHVEWTGQETTPHTLIQTLTGLGYGAAPYAASEAQVQSENSLKSLLKALAVAGAAATNVMLLSIAVWSGGNEMTSATHTGLHWISALIALPAVAYAGQPFFRSAWAALKNRHTNMDVPISLAVLLACALSLYETIHGNPDTYFDAALMLLFLLLIGRYLDARLRLKTGEAAQRLAAMQSTSATRIKSDGQLETVPAIQINPGDRLLIPVGQRIPVDATVLEGTSEIDNQIATGETTPELVSVGAMIYSGTVNLTAPLTVKAVARHEDSFLSEITRLVEVGEQSKSRFIKIADRAARAYVPVVHSLALMTFIGWLIAGAGLRPASLNAIAVLIITCPCALGLAVPAVQIVASGRLFARGIFMRSGDVLERLAKITHVVFDKTGTLTEGKFTLINRDEISRENLAIAAALSARSRHPIAVSLHKIKSDIVIEAVEEIAGQGLSGQMEGLKVSFGARPDVENEETVQTVSWLSVEGRDPVRFVFSDKARKDAQETIRSLSAMGLTSELLSGDRPAVAQSLAKDLGITKAKGHVSPQDKQTQLLDYEAQGIRALMVGDGINDAPALAAAHVSASLAAASDISRAASDIILQGDELTGLPNAIRIARLAHRRMVENLSLAVIYNFIAVPLAVFGFVNPLIAALAMSGSSLIVTLNALRMMRA